MSRKFHFISGLPRSGSTLLSALLRQNPRFYASISSPVYPLTMTMQRVAQEVEVRSMFNDERRSNLLYGVIHNFYQDEPASREVIVDTNRGWTGQMSLLNTLHPEAKIICCVRDIFWIVNSFERMFNKNPLQASKVVGFERGKSVYSRVDNLMNGESGVIGSVLNALREAWFGDYAKRLIVVQYDTLTSDPKTTLDKLYAALGEAPFEHDFDNVEFDAPEYDEELGMPGLHKVRKKVSLEVHKPSIPPDLYDRLIVHSFWKDPAMNVNNVMIL